MIAKKKEFYTGAFMLLAFAAVLVFIFSPIYHGKNGLCFLDNMFNAMSKGSAYYIPVVKTEAARLNGKTVALTLKMDTVALVKTASLVLGQANARVTPSGKSLMVTADLGQVLDACLKDADAMYHNNGTAIRQKYQTDERMILFNWYQLLKNMEKGLTKQKLFKEAKIVAQVNHKAVETAYNYYKVEAKSVKASAAMLGFALAFYVLYTLWYGFGIMFVFEGLGMQIEH
ncbi:MAG: hypothetical protein JEZ12_15680 [Desulfobacterium sp.]|nr:hypothetical protein [Desulfobacterium sp.]